MTRSTRVWLSEPFTPLGVVNLQFQAHSYSDSDERGWVLFTNLPLESTQDTQRVVALYASRWAVEEIFVWTKTALEWIKAFPKSSMVESRHTPPRLGESGTVLA